MFKRFKQASKDFCSVRWHLSWAKYLQGSFPNSDVERLSTQCFKSVWLTVALSVPLLARSSPRSSRPLLAFHRIA